jgi:hypothetical protein
LLLFFWQSAGRWGRIVPAGVLLPFSFTHTVLAELVGARRATITTALGQLRARGEVEYTTSADGSKRMILTGKPPEPARRRSGVRGATGRRGGAQSGGPRSSPVLTLRGRGGPDPETVAHA